MGQIMANAVQYVDKCKMMHFGFNNTRHTYTMNNKELQTVSKEK